MNVLNLPFRGDLGHSEKGNISTYWICYPISYKNTFIMNELNLPFRGDLGHSEKRNISTY
jgi:hypothetical protein